MNSRRTTSSSFMGIAFCGLLTITFIILRLCGVIDWSWWWVLSPIWIPASIVGLVLTIIVISYRFYLE